ncbi:Unconventional myosin-XV like protein [Argiope bruennichi]|uniref:Unconventional myosin-XV like protein n=1 Tax=Argiope bruennichi TaxID=94029 RepID=A0A8T0EAD9_ARGBR|nr:Unconventional myosin-XV like protein [Argiope bruennichi]
MKSFADEKTALAWAGCRKGNSTFFVMSENSTENAPEHRPAGASAERHSFLQYAMLHFRENPLRGEQGMQHGGSMRGTTKIIDYLTRKRTKKGHFSDWTWKELTDKVKYSPFPIVTSLLKLKSEYLNRLAVDSFTAIMRYMGDLPLGLHQREVECVYNILVEGKLSKQHTYFLPGGLQIALQTSASTVVEDIVRCISHKMGIEDEVECREFSLYCIVEGDQYTMPLERDEYILDLVAELEKNENIYYLVFCRSVWNFPLRLDSELYIDIIFHQIVPDYLEGYLLILPSHHVKISQETQEELLRITVLLHKARGSNISPTEKDMLSLLPKTTLETFSKNTESSMNYISRLWDDIIPLNATEAKAQCLEILQKWPLFGSCFFGIKMLEDNNEEESILAINKMGANVLDIQSHETLWRFSFSAIYTPSNIVELQGTTYADVVFGDETIQKIIRLQIDHAHEVTRLIKQYEVIQIQSETKNVSMNYPAVMIKI